MVQVTEQKSSSKVSGKLSLFDCFNLLFLGKEDDLDKISSSYLFVLIRWLSFNKGNVDICNYLNVRYKYIHSDIVKYLLYYKIDVSQKYIKYNKSLKDDKLDFVKDYLKTYFKYSEREYVYEKPIIDELLKKDDFKQLLRRVFGFSDSECRKLGIKFESVLVKRKDNSSASLFSFAKKC